MHGLTPALAFGLRLNEAVGIEFHARLASWGELSGSEQDRDRDELHQEPTMCSSS